ncbi:hypothetical protein BJX96DRAFT_142333 [Aspergillus floccosus]
MYKETMPLDSKLWIHSVVYTKNDTNTRQLGVLLIQTPRDQSLCYGANYLAFSTLSK